MTTHHPKGGMCAACVHAERDCSHLPFSEYPIIKVYRDGSTAVKCAEFEKQKAAEHKEGKGANL